MRPFSSGPDGDHPAGEIDGSVLIEHTVHLSTIQKVLDLTNPIQKVLDLTTQNSTPILRLSEKFELYVSKVVKWSLHNLALVILRILV